jgi:hypothetical protein
LRVQYGMTGDAAEALHKRVLAAAEQTAAPLDQVKAAIAGYAQAGGDVAGFADKVDLAARAVSLLGGQGDDVGRMLASLEHHFDIKGPEELTRTLAALYEQSLKVPGGFAEMTAGIDRTAELYASLGHLGPQAAREIGAVYAMMAKGTGNARQARSELQGFLEALQEPFGAGQRSLMSIGVNLGSGADLGAGKLPAITDILKQIGAIYQKDPFLVRAALGPQLTHDLQSMFADIARAGSATTLDQKLGVAGDPAKMLRDQAEAASTMAAELSKLHTQFAEFGDTHLTGALRLLRDLLHDNGSEIVFVSSALAGLYIGSKLLGGLNLLAVALQGVAAALLGVEIAAAPIAAAIALVTAALVAAYEAYKHWDEIKKSFAALPETLPQVARQMTKIPEPGDEVDPMTGFVMPRNLFAGKPLGSGNGSVTIKIEDETKRARVKDIKGDGLDVDVYMGYPMVGP